MNAEVLREFSTDMRLANLREATMDRRLAIVARLGRWLAPTPLLEADQAMLTDFERGFAHLAPASVDIYVRHLRAFYGWALGKALIGVDPSSGLVRPKLRRGRPHPTSVDQLRVIFACTHGPLRVAYTLAAFAGLRCGEISRLRREDLDLVSPCPTADVEGKAGKPRTVPLLEPVVAELLDFGLPRRGWLLIRKGSHYAPKQLSLDSTRYLHGLGVRTTLHSMRHSFATTTYQSTRDLLLLKELLGHESVATTQIYAKPDLDAAHARLAGVADVASSLLGPQRLRLVR